jgi:hypothetical protein
MYLPKSFSALKERLHTQTCKQYWESGDTVAWLTPHASVARNGGRAAYAWNYLEETAYRFSFNAEGKEIVTFAFHHEHLLEICDIVVRLLAVSSVHSVVLGQGSSHHRALLNAPNLTCLMEQCQSLKILSLNNQKMDEDHCRVLGAYSRPDLEIILECCTITDAGAFALAEVLKSNQGPTKFDFRRFVDHTVLADGLRGSSRLKVFKANISNSPDGN